MPLLSGPPVPHLIPPPRSKRMSPHPPYPHTPPNQPPDSLESRVSWELGASSLAETSPGNPWLFLQVPPGIWRFIAMRTQWGRGYNVFGENEAEAVCGLFLRKHNSSFLVLTWIGWVFGCTFLRMLLWRPVGYEQGRLFTILRLGLIQSMEDP